MDNEISNLKSFGRKLKWVWEKVRDWMNVEGNIKFSNPEMITEIQ